MILVIQVPRDVKVDMVIKENKDAKDLLVLPPTKVVLVLKVLLVPLEKMVSRA